MSWFDRIIIGVIGHRRSRDDGSIGEFHSRFGRILDCVVRGYVISVVRENKVQRLRSRVEEADLTSRGNTTNH